MHIRDILITGKTAKLPGDYSPKTKQATARHSSPPTAPTGALGRWTVRIDGWMPVPLNKLMNSHWGKASRLKKMDRETIGLFFREIPPATRKRRISMLIVLSPKMRAPDPDSFEKSLRDALVQCGVLRNDSHLWVEGQPVEFARGKSLVTFITLEDI